MSKTLKIAGTLTLPIEDGQAVAPVDLTLQFVFTQSLDIDLSYSVLTTDDPISLGTMATGGAKLLLIKSSVGGCTVKLNGSSDSLSIGITGYLLYTSPSGGVVTELSVTTTGAAKVKILALA
jgi:hypothetical protein